MVRSLLLVLSTILLASCGGGGGSSQDGGPAGFAPTLSVNGTKVGTQPVVVEVDEGTTDVAMIASTGGTLSVSVDNDGALFTLAADGQLSFIDAPDFETPGGDGSNSYKVRVDATSSINAAVTLTVQVQDVAEGSVIDGRVVDGPVSGAAVYADLNCNAMQDSEEPFGSSDADGFFQLRTDVELAEGCAGKFYSIGGTDTTTGKTLENIQLSADLPTKVAALDDSGEPILNADGSAKQVFPKVAITPLSTIIAAAATPEAKLAVLTALGLEGLSVQEALTIDPWAGAQSTDTSTAGVAAAAVAAAIQRVNTQVATIIKVAASLARTSESGTQTAAEAAASLAAAVQAVARAIVVKAVAAVAESEATGVKVTVNLASASVIASLIEETIIEVATAAAIASGSTAEEAAVIATAKVAQVQTVITAVAAKVEIVNTAAADENVNPTSAAAIALAVATESTVIAQVVATVDAVKVVIDAGGSVAEIAAVVVTQTTAIDEVTVEDILKAIDEAIKVIEEETGVVVVLPDLDGDGIPDITDPDDDGDGVNDSEDAFPRDATESLDTDSDGVGNNTDTDDDGDGVADTADAFPLDPKESVDTDSDGTGNNADTDDDNDGVSDLDEATLGTDPLLADTDGDADNDGADNCPLVKNAEQVDTDEDGTGNVCDTDDDADTVLDGVDNCPLIANTDQADTDGDEAGNVCDTDDDGDTILDGVDNCPLIANTDQLDTDGDKAGNVCDTDDDADTILDTSDNCPVDSNKDQLDTDGDLAGNACDADDDADTILDGVDNCPLIANTNQLDTDTDGVGDVCDTDIDGDTVLNDDDVFPLDSGESADTDGDKIGDNADNCPAVANADQVNTDGLADGGNACDADDDEDGVADTSDDFPLNAKLSSSFRLNSVRVADYVDQDRTMATYATAATMDGGDLTLALADGVVIDRSNLKNLVDKHSTTGTAPKLLLALDNVPAADTAGTVTLELMLMENDDLDQTYQTIERKLTANVTVNWKSDGTNVEMTVPAGGTATLGYAHNSNSYALSRVNGAADVVTFNQSDKYSNTPASIEVRAIDFFAAAAAANAEAADFSGLNLGSFFDGANNYHISVGIAQGADLGNFFYQTSDVLITKIMANLKLGEVPGRFNLHRVGLLDYVDGMSNKAVVYGLSPTVSAAGKLSVAMGTGNVVDLSNLKSLVDSNGTTGMAPRLLLAMDSVPASGESGSMGLTITLLEGADADQSSSERMLTGSITANWSADASGDVAVTVPAQSLSMTYSKGGTIATVTRANGAADMITLSQSKAFENFPATLEVRILDWFTAATKTGAEFAGIDLAGFFEAGDYTVMVTIDQGTDEVLYYRRAENAALLTSLQASLTVGEAATTTDKYDVMVDDWSTMSSSPVELHVIYPAGTPREEIRLHPAVNGKTMEFDFGPSMTIKKAHINGLLNGTADAGELVPALQFKMANVPTISGAFTLKMTVGGGGLTMTSMVDVSYNGSDFTVPSQTQDVTVTDSSVCQSGCTFTLESTAETLDISAPGIYPPTLTAKLISLFDLNLAGRNSEVTVELQAGNFDLVIEVLSDGTSAATTVDNILTYGGVPINKVEGVIIIE